MSKPSQFADWPDTLDGGYGPYRAVCDRVVDGDTMYVLIDQGLNNYAYESIRLKGVFAPELFSGTDRVAGAAAKAQLEVICPVGTKLLVYTEQDRMTFGRYVGMLMMQDGSYVNDAMSQWLAERA